MNVCVVGLGKIGLPLAAQCASQGISTTGIDIDPNVVETVNAGEAPFDEPELAAVLGDVVAAGTLRASVTASEVVAAADAVIVVVPLVIDDRGAPDFGAIDAATRSVGSALTTGTLVVYETTVPVGTTRDRCLPILEETSGLTAGRDFHLAYSPERVSSGTVFRDLRRYPKLVGGIDEASAKAAVDLYRRALEFDVRPDLDHDMVWDLGSTEAAEFTKLAETTYRDVNIALANEFAAHAEDRGLDVHEIIEAANSQPFSHIHRPGIAVGGHCIPVYPHLYSAGDTKARLPVDAREVNRFQPDRLVGRLADELGGLDGRTVAVLGAAYRGGVKETAFSGVFDVVTSVKRRGGLAKVHDPLYSDGELRALGFDPYRLGQPCDAAVIQADHDEYRTLAPRDLPDLVAILDGRSILDPAPWTDHGVAFIGIGTP
jgi:nucleotide sugar dehydrogenase